jgi:hypothetical protein
MAFRDPYHVAIVAHNLEGLKETNSDFSTDYAKFQYYATDIQRNDLAKPTTLMRGLNTKTKDALAQSDNVPQWY